MASDNVERQDRIERRLAVVQRELDGLQQELDELRRLATAHGVREPFPSRTERLPIAEPPPVVQPSPVLEAPLAQAWTALEHGREHDALRLADPVLQQALESGDESLLTSLAQFATAVGDRGSGARRDRALSMLEQIEASRAGQAGVSKAREAEATPKTQKFASPPSPSGPSMGKRLAEAFSGPRGFAISGGVVTLLGVVFIFVLAANRGWIGPVARVSFGAVAAILVLSAGIVLRVRYGRLQASLAAVGTGIAGGYVTLAAATITYGFLPSWGALVVAAVIASVGANLALRWSSELLAGLSLVGAAAAPGVVALDEEVGAPGTAFAVVVLAVALVAAARRGWLWLAAAVGAVSLAQVVWLVAVASAVDAGALAVSTATAAVLLCAAIVWQSIRGVSAADLVAQTLTLASGALGLWSLRMLLPSAPEAGVGLGVAAAVYVCVACIVVRRWRGLGWTAAGVGLVLAGIATSDLFSQRSLTVAWAVEAAALAVPAWRLASTRLELTSIAYLALGIAHAFSVDIWINSPAHDLARSSSFGLYALGAAAVVVGVLAVGGGRERPDDQAPLADLWTAVVAARGTIRFFMWGAAVALVAAGTAAVLSGRWLTVALAAAGAALALIAFALGERRLQAAAATLAVFATLHGLVVEATPATLLLSHEARPLAPVPSLAAVALGWLAIGLCARFTARGIGFLGPLEGEEQVLDLLGTGVAVVRESALAISVWFGIWAAGLLFIDASYAPGQAGATALWAAAAVAAGAISVRRRSLPVLLAAGPPTAFAYAKAVLFDWHKLGNPYPSLAVFAASLGVLLVGLLARYALTDRDDAVTGVSLATAALAVVSALIGVDRLVPDRTRVLGGGALVVAAVVATLALAPYRSWRRGNSARWLRALVDGYGMLALLTIAFAELCLFNGGLRATGTVWALSGAIVATSARPLAEDRLWLVGAAWSGIATVLCLTAVTTPSRLFVASAHPGTGLWVLAACIVALVWVVRVTPRPFGEVRPWVLGSAEGLTVFGLSLGVLALAEWVSGASVATDFQRGHTGVSALWGVLALTLFVAGLRTANSALRRIGLVLFGLSLAKLFLYDLSSLSSITRSLSFLAVGAILLAAAFFVERNIHGGGRHGPPLGV